MLIPIGLSMFKRKKITKRKSCFFVAGRSGSFLKEEMQGLNSVIRSKVGVVRKKWYG